MRWPWPLACAAAALTAALVVAAAALAAVAPSAPTVAIAAVGAATGSLSAGLGAVVARRARGNPVGALLALAGMLEAGAAAREGGWGLLAEHPASALRLNWLVALLAESSIWLFAVLALLLL